jgi:hypothetical protein
MKNYWSLKVIAVLADRGMMVVRVAADGFQGFKKLVPKPQFKSKG